ncbi:MAG: hypothetical protein IJ723_05740, partial [Ruminococcus sp.]|nr:hypothetical protein [Ruminococcus sp.]
MGFGTVMLIAAIVLLIMLLNEKKKTKRIIQFMTQLLQQNRISRQEHDSVINGIGTPGVPPAPMQQPAQPMPTPSAPQQSFPWQSFGQTQPAPQPQMQPAPQIQPIPQMQTQPQYNMPTNFPPKPQRAPMQPKPVNPAAIMLFIGVAFVILSGVIFSTANWHSMSDMQRVGLVAAAAAFFFGVSAFARRKLKLISTGLAFYMLGGVFTGISFLSLGYFRLMGDWFSTSGDGSYALYSVFMLIITAFSAGTSILYKKTAFTHAALYGAAVSLSLVAFQIAGSADS